MNDDTMLILVAIIVPALLMTDSKSPAWGFLLGATIAIGLYGFARVVLLGS